MTYHVAIALPDGRTAYADHREPVAKYMHRINRKIEGNVSGRRIPFPGNSEDYQAVAAWLDTHRELSESCRIGTWPGITCIHDEVPGDRVMLLPSSGGEMTATVTSSSHMLGTLVRGHGFTPEQARFIMNYTATEKPFVKEWKTGDGFITLRYHDHGRYSLENHPEKGVASSGEQGYTRESKAKIHPRRDSQMPPTARGRRTSTATATPARRSAPAPAPEPEPEENGQVDFQRYLDRDITPTMQDYVTWFEENVAQLEDVPIDKILTLGPTLYGHFQRSDFNVQQREARRAARARNSDPEPEPEPEPEQPKRRGRPAATSKTAPSAPTPAAPPARRGRGRPAKTSAEAPY